MFNPRATTDVPDRCMPMTVKSFKAIPRCRARWQGSRSCRRRSPRGARSGTLRLAAARSATRQSGQTSGGVPPGLDRGTSGRIRFPVPEPPRLIAKYYFEQHVVPLLRARGYESVLDFVATQAERAREGARPVSIALYGSSAAELAPRLARRLLERKVDRFHIDCLGVSESVAQAARLEARQLSVTGYLSLMCPEGVVPRRSPGTYDVHFSQDFLYRGDDRAALLDSIDASMTPSSVLVLSEPIGEPGVEAREARDIVGFLCSKLLPRHGTLSDVEPVRAMPRDNGLMSAVEERFALAACMSFGGIVDPFIEPSTGLAFHSTMSEDRRFIDFVGNLEQRLRNFLSPTRVIAAVGKSGSIESPATFPLLPSEAREQLVIPEETWFDFEAVDEVFAHLMDGKSDRPYLGTGFYEWDSDAQVRWAGPLFSLKLPVPQQANPLTCRVLVECHTPVLFPSGGLSVFAGGRRVKRIEDVYSRLRENNELSWDIETHGGDVEVTCAFDQSQKTPDSVDDRDLSVAINRFTASIVWKS